MQHADASRTGGCIVGSFGLILGLVVGLFFNDYFEAATGNKVPGGFSTQARASLYNAFIGGVLGLVGGQLLGAHLGRERSGSRRDTTSMPQLSRGGQPLLESHISGWPCRRGKVRDVYDLGAQLVIVATDRLSAFDWVLPTAIPDKGRVLTAVTQFWLGWLDVPHHLLGTDLAMMGPEFAAQAELLSGRTMLVRKASVVPFECVVRGYLAGSGWKEYRRDGTVCGIPLPSGLRECERLPEPIFTPATKAETGHDLNVSFATMASAVGLELALELRQRSLDIYQRAAAYAESRGILLADTKFEWGRLADGSVLLIDEVLTPDSSRFWPAASYRPGSNPPSFDKQFVRDWLEQTGWDKHSPPPALPDDVVRQTRAKYLEALERLTCA